MAAGASPIVSSSSRPTGRNASLLHDRQTSKVDGRLTGWPAVCPQRMAAPFSALVGALKSGSIDPRGRRTPGSDFVQRTTETELIRRCKTRDEESEDSHIQRITSDGLPRRIADGFLGRERLVEQRDIKRTEDPLPGVLVLVLLLFPSRN